MPEGLITVWWRDIAPKELLTKVEQNVDAEPNWELAWIGVVSGGRVPDWRWLPEWLSEDMGTITRRFEDGDDVVVVAFYD